MNQLIFTYLLIALIACASYAQERKSIHQIQSEFYAEHPELVGKEEVKFIERIPELERVESLSHIIYGFHPYWISDATAANYYYSLLTHVAYFSAEVDTTGGFTTTRNWSTTQVVNYTKSAGKKIHLTVTMFSNHSKLLSNASRRQTLVNNILTQIRLRNADGACVNFESMSSSVATDFRTFIKLLGDSLKANSLQLVVTLPAVDWTFTIFNSTFFSTVNTVVNYYFLMAYDYWYRGSTTAGPVSPLTTGTSIRHVMRSINDYLNLGATTQRLVAGFPYYGYDWPVVSDVRMAATTGTGTARTFAYIQPVIDTMSSSNKFFDAQYNVPWYRYQNGGNWRQTWYDDSLSLAKKYDSIKTKNIAGTGIWALGYDAGYTKLWGALKTKFASVSSPLYVNLDDFENGVGHFDKSPTYSGSTQGISVASTSGQTNYHANNGWASLQVILKDDASSSSNWTVRLLSGSGTPANNVALNSNGLIGIWMKTSSAPTGAQLALTIDDGAGGTELSPKLNVINDGNWNYYHWDFQSSGWTSFASGNGIINGPTVTLDAIMFYAPNASPDWTIYIDDVSYYQKPNDPLSFSATAKSLTRIDLNFVPNASNNNVIIVWNNTGSFSTPTGAPPSVGNSFAGGTLLYNGMSSPVIHSELTAGISYYYKAFSYDGYAYSTGLTTSATTFSQFTLNLTALLEGFYDHTADLMNPDTVTVELRSFTSPYTLIEQKKIIFNSSGIGTANFTTLIDGTPYYIVLKHRNSLETWSFTGNAFSGAVLNYNFTADSAKAYGFRMTKKGTRWCIYSGDINQDGLINSSDLTLIYNDVLNYSSEYLSTDITGDNFVDLHDLTICDNNKFNSVEKSTPLTE